MPEYIKKIEDEFIPHRRVSNINIHKGKVPLNNESVKKIKKKHFMETLYGDKRRKIRRARNQIHRLTRTIQKEFEMKLATEAKTNPKSVWKYMNSKTKNWEGFQT